MINVTDIPEVFGNLFNVDAEVGGIIISVIVFMAVIIAVSLVSNSLMAVSVSGITLIALFTFLGWFPIWLTIIIALMVIVLFARDAIPKGEE